MRTLRFLLTAIAVATAFGLGSVAPAGAGVYTTTASAQISIGDLVIEFSDQNAVFGWADSWQGAVGAGAADIPGDIDEAYDGFISDDGASSVTARTSWAAGGADAAVSSGTDVSGDTSASASVTGKYRTATAFGNASLDNFFYILGGAIGDPVTMTVSLDYTGLLSGEADRGGAYETSAIAFLSLYAEDPNSGFFDQLLTFAEFEDTATGSDDSVTRAIANTLTFSQELRFGEIYWLYAEADSEATAAVPVAGSLPLLLLGSVLLAWRRRRT